MSAREELRGLLFAPFTSLDTPVPEEYRRKVEQLLTGVEVERLRAEAEAISSALGPAPGRFLRRRADEIGGDPRG